MFHQNSLAAISDIGLQIRDQKRTLFTVFIYK